MLFLLFVYYLVQDASIQDASPIPSIGNRSLDAHRCADLSHWTSIWNIIWSCLVMIFSCTQVAVHPNVPCPKKRSANGWIERYI